MEVFHVLHKSHYVLRLLDKGGTAIARETADNRRKVLCSAGVFEGLNCIPRERLKVDDMLAHEEFLDKDVVEAAIGNGCCCQRYQTFRPEMSSNE